MGFFVVVWTSTIFAEYCDKRCDDVNKYKLFLQTMFLRFRAVFNRKSRTFKFGFILRQCESYRLILFLFVIQNDILKNHFH